MQTRILIVRTFSRCVAVLVTLVLLAWVVVLSGCATRKEVAAIVAESNAAMLAGQFGLPEANTTTGRPAWQEATDRIEAFITAHADQKTVVAPLRLRQALLLLSHGQFSLAQAAFNEVELGDLHTDRDQALKRNQATLIWWFVNSSKDTWTSTDQTHAQTALTELLEEQSRLSESPEIRDYFAEMRTWIGLSAAKQTASTDRGRELVEDALNVYAMIFTPDDLQILAHDQEQLPDPSAIGSEVRRRLRANAVLNFARQVNRDDALAAHPQNAFFNEWINR